MVYKQCNKFVHKTLLFNKNTYYIFFITFNKYIDYNLLFHDI